MTLKIRYYFTTDGKLGYKGTKIIKDEVCFFIALQSNTNRRQPTRAKSKVPVAFCDVSIYKLWSILVPMCDKS